ncbi:CHASE2 domain-containing protein [Pantanalinema rosaneae CENA516]|uniref:CHASE2 domain-containing protein n=1 Tax=Pantanalinema rosaneae TaxID=1620701 RepID=UPI003D6FB84A
MLGILLNDRYKIIRGLGSGGFGQTYLAEDIRQPGRPRCVVKQFQPASQDSKFLAVARRLFLNEVETLRKLGSHDRIPTLLDDFEEDQQFFLVQEYIEGHPLSEELAIKRKLPEPETIALMRDVLEVLEFVHRHHVIHRDIKPGNLMRRRQDGRIVLIDFGAVKEIQTQLTAIEPGQTSLTVGIGTQGYGASEQLMGKPRYSSDVYALGMTAIQALTGIHPSQLPAHPDTAEVIWRDRAQVSPWLASILDRMVRFHFTYRYQSATEVLRALDQTTEELVTEAPVDETLVPTTLFPEYPDPVVESPETPAIVAPRRWHPATVATLVVGIASAMMTGLVVGLRELSWLQPLELTVYDHMVQFAPDPGIDSRLLIVGITETDIQTLRQFPIADRTLAQLLKTLKTYQPRAIGVDLLRDIPQPPGTSELLTELQAPQVISITNLGGADNPPTPPPPGVSAKQIGFNDLVLDPDGVVRRNLIFADHEATSFHSFATRLALLYLAQEEIRFIGDPTDPERVTLGKATLQPLMPDSGGYQTIDDRGYQILLDYRSRHVARQVSLGDVMAGNVDPEWIRDKAVLIGTTAISGKDLFFTPYSAAETETARMPGVMIHAQILSQFLGAALDGQPLFWFWSNQLEILWIGFWAVAGGVCAWWLRHPILLAIGETILLVGLSGMGYGLFLQRGWVPIAAPAIAILTTGGIVVAYRAYGMDKAAIGDSTKA